MLRHAWLAGSLAWVVVWVSVTRRYCIKTAAGKWPADSERLNSSAINGAITSDTCFKTEVGIGTAGDDLSGNHRMTSSTVTDLKTGVLRAHYTFMRTMRDVTEICAPLRRQRHL